MSIIPDVYSPGHIDASFNRLRSSRQKSSFQGMFDLLTYAIYVPEVSRFEEELNPTLAHELIHFLQMAVTPLGTLHQNLNINLINAGTFLCAILNDHKIPLKIPLVQYARDLAKERAELGTFLRPHLQIIDRTIDILSEMFPGRSGEYELESPPDKIDIDVPGRRFLLDNKREVRVGVDLIMETMAWTYDHFVGSKDGYPDFGAQISMESSEYWLPWVYLAQDGWSDGLPYYLEAICWLSLMTGFQGEHDEYGYNHGVYKDPHAAVDVFLLLLSKGKEGSRILIEEIYNSLEEGTGNGNQDWFFDSIDATMQQIGLNPNGMRKCFEKLYHFKDEACKYFDGISPGRDSASRNEVSLFLESVGYSFSHAILEDSGRLAMPCGFFEDGRMSRPVIFFKDGLGWPNAFKSLPEWHLTQHLSNMLMWNSSLECYRREYAFEYRTPYFYHDCPNHSDCLMQVGKKSLRFCSHEKYREFVGAFFEGVRSISYDMLIDQAGFQNERRSGLDSMFGTPARENTSGGNDDERDKSSGRDIN